MSIREKIMEFINSKDYKPMIKEEILVRFGIDYGSRKEFYKILDSLEKEGLLIKTINERYAPINNEYLVVGVLEGHERGYGFVVPDDKDRDDIFIPAENMAGAMHGDRVVANILSKSWNGRRAEGEIIRILQRENQFIVGTFEESKNFGFLIPDDQRIAYDIFIPKSSFNNAKNRQKVVVEITRWPEPRRNPEER